MVWIKPQSNMIQIMILQRSVLVIVLLKMVILIVELQPVKDGHHLKFKMEICWPLRWIWSQKNGLVEKKLVTQQQKILSSLISKAQVILNINLYCKCKLREALLLSQILRLTIDSYCVYSIVFISTTLTTVVIINFFLKNGATSKC